MLRRAGEFEKPLLYRAVAMFEVRSHVFWFTTPLNVTIWDFLVYSNHVGLCTDEISEAGDA